MDPRIMKVTIIGDSMWPTYNDGDIIECVEYDGSEITISSIVVFPHPMKKNVTCVKRVTRTDGQRLFVQGDNPDPLASEDSHNFGWILRETVVATRAT